jgi:hypothetical protein
LKIRSHMVINFRWKNIDGHLYLPTKVTYKKELRQILVILYVPNWQSK